MNTLGYVVTFAVLAVGCIIIGEELARLGQIMRDAVKRLFS